MVDDYDSACTKASAVQLYLVIERRKERARTMLVECNNVRPVSFRTKRGVGKGEEGPTELVRICKRGF